MFALWECSVLNAGFIILHAEGNFGDLLPLLSGLAILFIFLLIDSVCFFSAFPEVERFDGSLSWRS
ncbi:hypothetical protein C9E85_14000 [Plesiomonas shigelloides]|nr:hypothetical protein C9E85_14000 [Plesiomonas shigelloides]